MSGATRVLGIHTVARCAVGADDSGWPGLCAKKRSSHIDQPLKDSSSQGLAAALDPWTNGNWYCLRSISNHSGQHF